MKENNENEIIIEQEDNREEKDNGFWYRKAYEKLTDLPSRVDFLLQAKLFLASAEERGVRVTEEEKKELEALEEQFVDRYITKGSEEEREGAFKIVGRLQAKNTLDSYDLYQESAKELSPKDPLHIKKSKWYFDQTLQGRNHKALEELTGSFVGGIPKKKGNGEMAKQWVKEGKEDFYREQRLSSSVAKAVSKIEKINAEDYDYADLKDWIKEVGTEKIHEEKRIGLQKAVYALEDRFKDKKLPYNASEIREQDKMAMKHYKGLKTMEEKFSFIMDYSAMMAAQEGRYGRESVPEQALLDMKEDFREKYIMQADIAGVKKLFSLLGEKTAGNMIALSGEYEERKKEFAKEGEAGLQKAGYLARASVPGVCNIVCTQMTSLLSNAFAEVPPCAKQAVSEEQIDYESVTVGEFINKYGNVGARVIQGYSEEMPKDDVKVLDLFIAQEGQGEGVRERALGNMKDAVAAMLPVKWMQEAREAVTGKAEFDEKVYAQTNKALSGEAKTDQIKGWPDGAGAERIQQTWNTTSSDIMLHTQKQFDKRVGFDQYIMRHTGKDVLALGEKEKKECLAKAVAADMLKDAGAEFSVKGIRKTAALLQNDWDFKRVIGRGSIDEYLSNPDRMREMKDRVFRTNNLVKAENLEEYIRQMDLLAKNMMPSEGRSDQYKNMYDTIKKIADLKTNCDFKSQKDMEAAGFKVAKLNQILVNTIDIYVTGKEKIRRTDDGKERFDNAMDALSIVSAHVSGRAHTADQIVSGINKKRGADYGRSGYISLGNYGANRAFEAKQKREEKKQAGKKKSEDLSLGLGPAVRF